MIREQDLENFFNNAAQKFGYARLVGWRPYTYSFQAQRVIAPNLADSYTKINENGTLVAIPSFANESTLYYGAYRNQYWVEGTPSVTVRVTCGYYSYDAQSLKYHPQDYFSSTFTSAFTGMDIFRNATQYFPVEYALFAGQFMRAWSNAGGNMTFGYAGQFVGYRIDVK